jgi:hypothetical protein
MTKRINKKAWLKKLTPNPSLSKREGHAFSPLLLPREGVGG